MVMHAQGGGGETGIEYLKDNNFSFFYVEKFTIPEYFTRPQGTVAKF